MSAKDWVLEAANEIVDAASVPIGSRGEYRVGVIAWLTAAIERHCPFKRDVAYMPVPRCASCANWDQETLTPMDTAECMLSSMEMRITNPEIGMLRIQMRTKADFGCTEWKEK